METKICKHCKEEKLIEDFYHNKARIDNLQDWCKVCMNSVARTWQKQHPRDASYYTEYRKTPNGMYHQMKKHGGIRNERVVISKEEFIDWFPKGKLTCHYCGRELGEYKNGDMSGLTIERLDNELPYKKGNIALACRRCNSMKGSWLTEEQMLDAAQRYFKGN